MWNLLIVTGTVDNANSTVMVFNSKTSADTAARLIRDALDETSVRYTLIPLYT